jgi:hypothetical protein
VGEVGEGGGGWGVNRTRCSKHRLCGGCGKCGSGGGWEGLGGGYKKRGEGGFRGHVEL